jgi:hypothetical protein
LPLLLDCDFKYVIRKVKETQVEPKVDGTCQLFVQGDVNLLGDNMNTIKKDVLIYGSNEFGREICVDFSEDCSTET